MRSDLEAQGLGSLFPYQSKCQARHTDSSRRTHHNREFLLAEPEFCLSALAMTGQNQPEEGRIKIKWKVPSRDVVLQLPWHVTKVLLPLDNSSIHYSTGAVEALPLVTPYTLYLYRPIASPPFRHTPWPPPPALITDHPLRALLLLKSLPRRCFSILQMVSTTVRL